MDESPGGCLDLLRQLGLAALAVVIVAALALG
jgi:hypothetical protein